MAKQLVVTRQHKMVMSAIMTSPKPIPVDRFDKRIVQELVAHGKIAVTGDNRVVAQAS